MNAKLTLAARLIEYDLRRIPFVPGRHRLAGRDVVLRPVVNADGVADENCLFAEITSDLPPYVLHRSRTLSDQYAQDLAQLTLSDQKTDALISMLQQRTCPSSVRVVRVLTQGLRPVIWAMGVFVHRREAAPKSRLGERFGNTAIPRPKSRVLWLHAASLGEVKKLQNILIELSQHADITPVVTTYTASSAQWMATTFPHVIHQYAPLDTPCYIDRFLNHWRPECLVAVENELWPNMILGSARRGMRLVQLGARASSSRRKYDKAVGYLMTHFNLITCVNDEIRRDFINLGIPPERVLTASETDGGSDRLPVDSAQLASLRQKIGKRPVWIAASTHPADVDIVLPAQAALCDTDDVLLIIAPRHPRDARSIARTCKSLGLSIAQRSLGEDVTENTHVYIADTFGELGTMFSIAKTVYLGGGIGKEGGHNPNEPAAFQCQILSGPNVANHEQSFAKLITSHQAGFVETSQQLAAAVRTRLETDKSGQPSGISDAVTQQNPHSLMGHTSKLVLDHILGTADNPEKATGNLV